MACHFRQIMLKWTKYTGQHFHRAALPRRLYEWVCPFVLEACALAREAWDMVRQAEVESQQYLDTVQGEIAQEDAQAAREISRLRQELEEKLQSWQEERRSLAEADFQQMLAQMDGELRQQMETLAQLQQARAQGVIDELIGIVEQNDGRM